ncbi:alcohol dehydrogenase family protein [Halomonas denitrificans]|uniref:alcohol dehydrogenase family protein n=1 Tax=Halomonas denitrificans TaxID=370769 RepID=UPI001CD57EF9|nr:alcohol dehydrogenase family protein [Halomonas denitrificans]MCA0975756.1 alcohol dehydrogenase family protein [Halomonas denitrificans]
MRRATSHQEDAVIDTSRPTDSSSPSSSFTPPPTMLAVVTLGNGGYDKLSYQRVATPEPGPGEVLLRVLAAGINNTEINTRLGWYSSSVTSDTQASSDSTLDDDAGNSDDGGWNGATPFPLIQGTDCCGKVVALGEDVDATELIGRRVLVRACMRTKGFEHWDSVWMASDFDGAFAQFVKVPASEVFAVDCDWRDAELATIPCAYGTAENMLHRAGVTAGDRLLVTGASGGVGSAVVQLAKRRGAHVTAVASQAKHPAIQALGADRLLDRHDDLVSVLGESAIDVAVDNVAGQGFGGVLEVLDRGGRYVSSGAIAGPVVELDMRKLYLKDIRLIGSTAWDEPVFPNLIGYIERGEIRPLLAGIFPLQDIVEAQKSFLEKHHVGNLVLIPPPLD